MVTKILSFLKKEVVSFVIYLINFVLLILFVIFLNLLFMFLTNRGYENVSIGISLFAFFSYIFCYYKFSTLVLKGKNIKKFFLSLLPIIFIYITSVVCFFVVHSSNLAGLISVVLLMFYFLYLLFNKKKIG